jgi:hypothetical protein
MMLLAWQIVPHGPELISDKFKTDRIFDCG